MIDSILSNHRLGGIDPAGPDETTDKALIPLAAGRPTHSAAKAIPDHPELAQGLVAEPTGSFGTEVYMVSAARPFHSKTLKGGFPPMMQKCRVLRIDTPGQIITNCDSHRGVSASRLFVPDPGDSSKLKSIGIWTRGREFQKADGSAIDNMPADPDTNSSMALVMDATYYDFPATGDAAVLVSGTGQ